MNGEYGLSKGVPNPIIKEYKALLRVKRAVEAIVVAYENVSAEALAQLIPNSLMLGELKEALKEVEHLI